MKYLQPSFSVPMSSPKQWPRCSKVEGCVLDMGHRGECGDAFPPCPLCASLLVDVRKAKLNDGYMHDVDAELVCTNCDPKYRKAA